MKKYLGKILGGAAAVLGLVAVIMLFVVNVKMEQGIVSMSYTGLHTVFGAKKTVEVLGTKVSEAPFKFSCLSLLPYLLAVAGIVFAGLAAFGKLGKIAPIVAAACFVVAAILFFLALQTCIVKFYKEAGISKKDAGFYETAKLGAGSIIAGIVSILAAGCSAALLFVKAE